MLPPSIVQVVQFAFDIGVCVILLGWIVVAFIDCRVLGELGAFFVVVVRWLCVVTGEGACNILLLLIDDNTEGDQRIKEPDKSCK